MKKKLLATLSSVTAIAAVSSALMFGAPVAEASVPNLKVLNEFSTGWVNNFNPWIGGRQSIDMVYEPLVIYNLQDNLKPHYWLASGYKMSDDLSVLTVTLREGVLWSDGKPFTADDVVFSFTYPQQHPEIDMMGLASKLDDVVKVDDHTVEFHLTTPNAFAAYDLIGHQMKMVPKHIWEGVTNPGQNTNRAPVGTGPFTEIERFTPQVYIQCRNPNYWNDELALQCLEFPQFANNDAALEMMAKGETDWNGIFVPDIDRTFVRRNKNNHYWFPSSDGVRITMNFQTKNEGAREAFENIHFRRAFNLAMDRDAMMMIGAYGYVTGDNPATNMPKVLWEWRDEKADEIWSEVHRFDIRAAKNELAQGGFKDITGNGYVETPTGKPVRFTIQVPSGWTDWVNNAAIAVEGLREAGIDATVITPEVNAYSQSWETGDFDACFCGGSMQSSAWKFYDYTMHSRFAKSPQWWSTGMTNYVNPELDTLIDNMGMAPDRQDQQAIAGQIEQLVASEVIQVPLYYNGVWYSYNDARFTGFYNEDNPKAHPAPWDNHNRLMHVIDIKPR